MKIIISPAKNMEECPDLFAPGALPEYLERTKILHRRLSAMSEPELRKLFGANDSITHRNFLRYRRMEPERAQTPALLSYVGIQYQYMAPKLFSYEEWEYVKEHLRILSGFYGILRPDDRVTPYRLEMQAKLAIPAVPAEDADASKIVGAVKSGAKHRNAEFHGTESCETESHGMESRGTRNLYEFWGDSLYRALIAKETGSPVILNLASKEYSRAVEPYLTPAVRYVTCVFGTLGAEKAAGKVTVRATEAKMARGEMVRYLAQNGIENVEEAKRFDRLGYRFRADLSDADRFVFIR